MDQPASPPNGPVTPYCEAERVFLRPIAPSDASLIAVWKSDPLVRRMALGPRYDASPEAQLQDFHRALESPTW